MTDYVTKLRTASTFPTLAYHPRACLGISLGNHNERGDRLLSIVHWMNANFKEVIIGLTDTLTRWNESDRNGVLLPDAYRRSRARGDAWLSENQEVLSQLTIPYEILRWDHWRSHPEFPASLAQFEEIYARNETFRAAVQKDADNFFARQKRFDLTSDDQFHENSRRFILEELAGYTILFRHHPGTIKIYPGTPLEADKVIRAGLVEGAPSELRYAGFAAINVDSCRPKIPFQRVFGPQPEPLVA